MDRMSKGQQRISDEAATRMFRRALSHWAADVLRSSPKIAWPEADPEADYRNRDWTQLYAGSILDD